MIHALMQQSSYYYHYHYSNTKKLKIIKTAVDAPNFVPIVGGLLAILTALLPIALRGGEEAFEEMKKTDGFGSGQDKLKSRK